MEVQDSLPPAVDSIKAEGSPVTNSSAARVKRGRSTGSPKDCCRTCRLRKVKCSGNPGNGPCINCSRLDLGCNFEQTSRDFTPHHGKVLRTAPSRSHTEAGTLRKRAQRACDECHTHKTKCSGDLPVCKRCESGNFKCVYLPAKRKFQTVPLSNGGGQEDTGLHFLATIMDPSGSLAPGVHLAPAPAPLPPPQPADNLTAENLLFQKDFVLRHVDVYFAHIYPLPCYGFLHPQTTYTEIDEKRFSPILATAVCSITGMLVVPGKEGLAFSARCEEQVQFYLFRNIGKLEIELLRLMCLCIMYNWVDGQWAKCWMYHGLACRLLKGLQLTWDTDGTFVEQESTRRLVWQMFIIDRYLAGGFEEHVELPEANMRLALPCSDLAFHEETPPIEMETIHTFAHSTMRPRPHTSVYALNCILMSIRHRILRLTKKFAIASTHPRRQPLELSKVMKDVGQLQSELTQFHECLPEAYKRSDRNTRRHLDRPEWAGYCMMHTWICQLHVDLYRFALPGFREQAVSELRERLPVEFLQQSQGQGIGWALSAAQFWESLSPMFADREAGPSKLLAVDFLLGICVVQSTKVLLVANHYDLYRRVEPHSTAPLRRWEVIDEAQHNALVQSNLAILDDISICMPRMGQMAKEVQDMIADYKNNPEQTGKDPVVGLPSVKPTNTTMRLPFPQMILENALMAVGRNDEDEQYKTNMFAQSWFGEMGKGVASPAKHGDAATYDHRPDLPLVLAQARGTVPAGRPERASPVTYYDMGIPPPPTANPLEPPIPAYGVLAPDSFSSQPEVHHPLTVTPHMMSDIVPVPTYSMPPQSSFYGDPTYPPDPVPGPDAAYYHDPHRGFEP